MQLFLLVPSVLAVYLFQAMTAAASTDFENTRHNFDFIYHDLKDLLLVVHGQDCYFTHMPNSNNKWTQSSSTRTQAEDLIVSFIKGNVPSTVQIPISNDDDDDDDDDVSSMDRRDTSSDDDSFRAPSQLYQVKGTSLSVMRDLFGDRLADFHCLTKNVFEVQLMNHFWNALSPSSGDDD